MVRRTYKYRLYPNKEQEAKLNETLETCRRTYNAALEERITAWKQRGESITHYDQRKAATKRKSAFQERLPSQVFQDVFARIDKTYNAFWSARKAGRAHGFPRFKSMERYNSFSFGTPMPSGYKMMGCGTRLRLSKIGEVKIKLHRPLPYSCLVKACTIIRDGGGDQWYACLSCEVEAVQTGCEFPDLSVGVDVGLHHFAALSNGTIIDNPRHYRAAESLLKRRQRQLSRKKKGSRNRAKARMRVARIHRRVRNQRQDFLHKTSTKLATTYGHIVFEKLNIRGMVKNRRLAKSISDAGWNTLIQYTTYKAESAGGRVELVSARNTSQACSGCGEIVKKSLSVRTHKCTACGLIVDRDENAARNIVARAV